MDEDDLDILNDAEELALFEKLDLIAAGGQQMEEDEEEELLIVPSSSKAALPTATKSDNNYNRNFETFPDRSLSPSTKKNVTFRQLEGIDYFQDKNRALIRAQANFLHPRAVLFVGSVMSVTLPSSVPFDLDNCELLYRVLFIEGGSQPAMFRCKTPIFTSTAVVLNHQIAVWDDNTFRFDMLMPDAEPGEDPHYLNIQGEVMVSLYRKKPNGGNDIVAQFSVDLQRMKQRGTKEIFEKDHDGATPTANDTLDGRSMNGTFPLQIIHSHLATRNEEKGEISDTNKDHGDIEIQFNIAWHHEDPRGQRGGVGASMDEGTMTSHTRSRTAGMTRSNNAASTTKPAASGGTKSAVPSAQRPKSATTNAAATGVKKATPQVSATNQYKYEQPRKIVSRLDRQRKEMERKIARENQILHSRIAKQVPDQGPGKSQASATLSQGKVTAYQNYDAVLSTVKKGSTSNKNNNNNTDDNPRIVNLPPDMLEKVTPQWKQYQQLYETLKKDIRDEENHVKDLRAKLSNINTQIQRQEAGAEKVKQLTSSTASTSGKDNVRQSQVLPPSQADGKEVNASLRASGDSKMSDSPLPPNSARFSTTNGLEGGDVELGAWSQLPYMPGCLENVQDGEYRQLAEEFQVLQRLRRSLLDRITEAKKHSGNATSQQQELEEKMNIVKRRLWHIKEHHSDTFGSVVLLKEDPKRSSNNNLSADAKRDSKDVAVDGDEREDLNIYDRLLSLRTEITTLQTQGGFSLSAPTEEMTMLPSGPAHPEILALQSTRSELEAMLHKLNTHIEKSEIEVSRLEQEQREKVSLVSDVASQRDWIDRRSFIADMRAMEMRLKREERLNSLAQASKDVELQMLHYRMLTKEREEMRQHQVKLDRQHEEYKKLIGAALSRPQSPLKDN